MTDREPHPPSPSQIKRNRASYIGAVDDSETRKKSPRGGLVLGGILLTGAVLFSPAVRAPLFLDDYLQGAMVEGTFPVPRSPWNLYDFVDDGARAVLTDRGLLPWWSHPHLAIRFLRPLSSGLVWMDHRVFHHGALAMHLHSLAWWMVAVLAVRFFYASYFSPRQTLLATAIFALAPCHALPLAWVANRETLVSLAFGGLALAAEARWRDERRLVDGIVASGLFTLAMLGGGEYALCFGGYVLAMDLIRRESLVRRVAGWVPFLVPAFFYLVVRGVLGYGTAGSGFYLDPMRDTVAFLTNAPSHAASLLATGWLTLDSEAWGGGLSRWLLGAIVGAVAFGLVVPVRRAFAALPVPSRRVAIWLLFGSIFALVPTLAVVSARRLLGVGMVGIAATVALVLDRAWFTVDDAPTVARGRKEALLSLAALGLGFAHLVHGPATAWLQSRRHRADAAEFEGRMRWLRERVRASGKTEVGVLRGTAGAFFAPFAIDARGRPPARWCVLAQAGHVLALRRDLHTLDLVAGEGRSLFPVGEHNLYRNASAVLHVGDVVSARGLRVTILEEGDGGPRSARFEFDDDPEMRLWINDAFANTEEVELPSRGFGAPFDP